MQAVGVARLAAPGGATSSPAVLITEPPPLMLVQPSLTAGDTSVGAARPPGIGGDQTALSRQAFGRLLHAARERSGVTLDDIARRTKVSASLLSALERGDASRWPKGIFRRAFFRDYVVAIGLPTESHITEFLRLFPDGEHHPVADSPAAPADPQAELRLTLGPVSPWTPSRQQVRRELVDLVPIVFLAIALTIWLGAGPLTGAGLVALSYVGRLTAGARSQVTSWWMRRSRPA
jgi:transcriptional regulator with XRE-family HTH domain